MGIVIRQSIKGTIVTYIGAFIGFLSTIFISTKFLLPEEIGLTRIIIEVATLLFSLSQVGVTNSGIRFFPYFKTKDGHNKGFFFYIVTIPIFGIVFFFLLYCIFKQPISAYFSKNSPLFINYYFWVLPLALFMIYQAVFEMYANVLMRIVIPKIVREIFVRLCTVIIIFLYAFKAINLNGLIAGTILTYGIAAIINFIYICKIGNISLKHNLKEDISPPLQRNILDYTIFFVFAAIGSLLIMKIDIFMISAKMGLNHTGFYSIAYFMAAIIEIPSRSIMAISQPFVSDSFKNNDLQKVSFYFKRVSLNQFLVGGLIFVFLWINIHNIFLLMPNGDTYKAGIWVVFFISLSKICDMITSYSAILLMISKYYRYLLLFVFMIAGLTIISNNIFIPIMGITGAALATFLSIVIYNTCMLLFVWVKLKVHPFSKNMLKILFTILFLFCINYIIPSFSNPIIDSIMRTFIVMVIALICIFGLNISVELTEIKNNIFKKISRKQ